MASRRSQGLGPARAAISLCVVARNEAAFIGACLESARPIATEMIVVDTGSTDPTAEIARRAGARVIRAEWPGDLGRAHNLPLEHARGDWILSLDADEILDPASRHRIAEFLRTGAASGYRLPIRNYTYEPVLKLRRADPSDPLTRGALGYLPTCPVRLFRRRPHHRFEGLLHQTVAPSIEKHGGRIGELPVPIHHYGDLRIDRAKTPFYRILSRRHAAAEPRNPRAWIDFGLTFGSPRQLPAALDAFRRARALGLEAEGSFFMGLTLLEMGRPRLAVSFLAEAIRMNRRDSAFHFDQADACELLGHALEGCGRRRAAEASYRRALRLRPESPSGLNNLAGLLIERNCLDAAQRLLDRMLALFPGLGATWATLGALRLHQGDLEGARRACEAAVDIDPRQPAALANLGLVHRQAGRRRQAAGADRAVREIDRPVQGERSRSGAAASIASSRWLTRLRRVDIVSVVAQLQGDAGRGLIDAVKALSDRTHLVLCADAGGYEGESLRRELDAVGVRARLVGADADVSRVVARASPGVVLHHCGRDAPFLRAGPARHGRERWIAIGHAPLPMVTGYDAYVVKSRFHEQFQRHLPPEQVHRIPDGVDLRRFGRSRRAADDPVTVAMLGRLDPGTFPRQLLAMLPALEDVGARLVIAGGGARRYELGPEIDRRGLSSAVRFLGRISAEQVPAFLAAADIGLHLTETSEEISAVATLEMMAAGLPIVAEPKGCLPEIVTPRENGFLLAGPGEVAVRLAELIQSSSLRRRMGEASRRRVAGYSMDRYRMSMRALVGRAGSARRARPSRQRPPRLPEALSLATWQPSLSYLVCAEPQTEHTRLSEALQETGIAGFPEQGFRPEMLAPPSAGGTVEDLRARLASVLEAGTSPNGVFGASLSLADLNILVRVLKVLAGRARTPSQVMATAFPNLRYVWLTRRDAGGAETAAWHAYFATLERPPVMVMDEDFVRDGAAIVRSVLRQLGVRARPPASRPICG